MTWDEMVAAENASIRRFLERHNEHLVGRVLDYGSGRQPYKQIVEDHGIYIPFDPGTGPGADWRPHGPYDTFLCTQVVQFLPDVAGVLGEFRLSLVSGGRLVMTYPTCWPIVNHDDLWRFTENGMNRMLERSGFTIVASESRGGWTMDGYELPFGFGVVALAL